MSKAHNAKIADHATDLPERVTECIKWCTSGLLDSLLRHGRRRQKQVGLKHDTVLSGHPA
eukprot:5221316-Amphidinium_carterae.1